MPHIYGHAPAGRLNACTLWVSLQAQRGGMEASDLFRRIVEAQGIVSVEYVVEGLMQLLDDDKQVGSVMRVTRERGIDYQNFGRKSKL